MSGIAVFAQPAKKEHVNKGRDEGQNPREHLREPGCKEALLVARLGRGAGFGSKLAAGESDFQRYLGVGTPEPVCQRCHKKEQQQCKQGYAAFLFRYYLHLFPLPQGAG